MHEIAHFANGQKNRLAVDKTVFKSKSLTKKALQRNGNILTIKVVCGSSILFHVCVT